MSNNLRSKTIKSLLWNTVDKVFTQVCYALTGIVLANLLFPEDFGLVSILAAFTAFANIFIEGGFSSALIQQKNPTNTDYSTIFIFNIIVSVILYILFFFSAPLIAKYFNDERLIILSRVMFLNLLFISCGLVQSSILMKEMKMKKYAIINTTSLLCASAISLVLAFINLGVWALIAQILGYSFCRSVILWLTSKWYPQAVFSLASLKKIFGFGSHMLFTSFINTFFQRIYTFLIGLKYTMQDLGYYHQAEKWSNMGTSGLSQIIGYTAFPALSSIQDDRERMKRVFSKMNKMTSYLTFPIFAGLMVLAQPLFFCLFGNKWDSSVYLFQLFLLRGVFFIFTSLLNNYLMAIGYSKVIFKLELVKDLCIVAIIFITLPISIPALIIGQAIAVSIHFILTAIMTSKYTGYNIGKQFLDMLPYIILTVIMTIILYYIGPLIVNPYWLISIQIITGGAVYLLMNKLLNSKIQKEIFETICRKRNT